MRCSEEHHLLCAMTIQCKTLENPFLGSSNLGIWERKVFMPILVICANMEESSEKHLQVAASSGRPLLDFEEKVVFASLQRVDTP